MNDNAGDGVVLDTTGNHNGETISTDTSVMSTTSGKIGRALVFTGDADIISIPDDDDFHFGAGDFTINFWFKANELKGESLIFSKSTPSSSFSAVQFGFDTTAYYLYQSYTGSAWNQAVNSIGVATLKVWTMLTIMKNSTNMKIYQDGELVRTISVGGNDLYWDNGEPITLGNMIYDEGTTQRMTHGVLDDVRIYNRALDTDEIAELLTGTEGE